MAPLQDVSVQNMSILECHLFTINHQSETMDDTITYDLK